MNGIDASTHILDGLTPNDKPIHDFKPRLDLTGEGNDSEDPDSLHIEPKDPDLVRVNGLLVKGKEIKAVGLAINPNDSVSITAKVSKTSVSATVKIKI